MINEICARSYCKDYTKIENYEKAIADTTQTWEVHHRLERCFLSSFLKKMNLYYDVEPQALIFLTRKEHLQEHMNCVGWKERKEKISENNAWKGKHLPESTRKKISESAKGENNSQYGKHLSEETKEKLRKGNKKRLSEIRTAYYNREDKSISWNQFQKLYKETK